MNKLIPPTLFNIITIAAMLLSLFQLLTEPAIRTTPTMIEAIQILEEIVEKGAPGEEMGQRLSARLVTDQEQRQWFVNGMIAAIVVAIVSNVIANSLGRGRQHANSARIHELEAELRNAMRPKENAE